MFRTGSVGHVERTTRAGRAPNHPDDRLGNTDVELVHPAARRRVSTTSSPSHRLPHTLLRDRVVGRASRLGHDAIAVAAPPHPRERYCRYWSGSATFTATTGPAGGELALRPVRRLRARHLRLCRSVTRKVLIVIMALRAPAALPSPSRLLRSAAWTATAINRSSAESIDAAKSARSRAIASDLRSCLVDVNGLGACQLFDEIRVYARLRIVPGELVCGAGRCHEQVSRREAGTAVAAPSAKRLEGTGPAPRRGVHLHRPPRRGGVHLSRRLPRRAATPTSVSRASKGTCRPECFSDRECPFGECLPLAGRIAGVPAGAGAAAKGCLPQRAVYRVRVGGTGDGSSWGRCRLEVFATRSPQRRVDLPTYGWPPDATRPARRARIRSRCWATFACLVGFCRASKRAPKIDPPIGEMETILSGDLERRRSGTG